jgi:hypothetical protein
MVRPSLVRGKLFEFGEEDGASIQTPNFSARGTGGQDRPRRLASQDRMVDREEPVSGKTVMEVVESLDRNLQHVASETCAGIDGFLNSRR